MLLACHADPSHHENDMQDMALMHGGLFPGGQRCKAAGHHWLAITSLRSWQVNNAMLIPPQL